MHTEVPSRVLICDKFINRDLIEFTKEEILEVCPKDVFVCLGETMITD